MYGTLTDAQVYLGQCFGRAYLWMDAQRSRAHDSVPITSARLVHGIARGEDPLGAPKWFWHAWVDVPGNRVFDGVVQRFYTKEIYRAVTEAEELATYEWKTAKWLREHRRHLGPWYFAEQSALRSVLERHSAVEVGSACKACAEGWPCATSGVLLEIVRLQTSPTVPEALRRLLRIGEVEDIIPALQRRGFGELAMRVAEHVVPASQ